jgi:hypothetical protein
MTPNCLYVMELLTMHLRQPSDTPTVPSNMEQGTGHLSAGVMSGDEGPVFLAPGHEHVSYRKNEPIIRKQIRKACKIVLADALVVDPTRDTRHININSSQVSLTYHSMTSEVPCYPTNSTPDTPMLDLAQRGRTVTWCQMKKMSELEKRLLPDRQYLSQIERASFVS